MGEKENNLEQEEFLKTYRLRDCFSNSGLQWSTLEKIYEDYKIDINTQRFKDICKEFEEHCRKKLTEKKVPYHSIRCRHKDPEHLIEKIIRKRGREQISKYKGIDVNNYKEIVHDLIGLRILVIKKEDWESVFDAIVRIFPNDKNSDYHMEEPPKAYIRYGDRDIYGNKIKKEYSNKGYRSQHYIVWFEGFYCEIQVRTLAEEVHGEFEHIVKYPYRNENKFLIRYTDMVSRLTNTIDEMISTCLQIPESGWDANNEYFKQDRYQNWVQTSQSIITETGYEADKATEGSVSKSPVNVKEYADRKLLRKEN